MWSAVGAASGTCPRVRRFSDRQGAASTPRARHVPEGNDVTQPDPDPTEIDAAEAAEASEEAGIADESAAYANALADEAAAPPTEESEAHPS